MAKDETYEEPPKGNRRNDKEINRCNLLPMIAKETLPALQWPALPRHHVDRDRRLRDIDAQFELVKRVILQVCGSGNHAIMRSVTLIEIGVDLNQSGGRSTLILIEGGGRQQTPGDPSCRLLDCPLISRNGSSRLLAAKTPLRVNVRQFFTRLIPSARERES